MEITRSASEGQSRGTIEGIAARIEEPYIMGFDDWQYMEVIKRGAFDKVLNDDVRIVFNHGNDKILARTKSGTGEVFLTQDGHLAFRYTTPERSYAIDLEDAIAKGDVDECSFAFRVEESNWVERDGELPTWEIVSLSILKDVGPVTYGANPGTSVNKRSAEALKESYDNFKASKKVKPVAKRMSNSMEIRKRQLSLIK